MDDELIIVLSIIGGCVLALLVILGTVGGFGAYDDFLIAKATSQGIDPIKASCAIRGINQNNQLICANK